jgi:hypothetical protein
LILSDGDKSKKIKKTRNSRIENKKIAMSTGQSLNQM